MADDPDEAAVDEWYRRKTAMMVERLGEEYGMVMHAIIPFFMGGGLDLYYFPNGIDGTAIATKELSEAPGNGSSNDLFENYELVMFTRHQISMDDAKDEGTPFGRAHSSINSILNCMARYSADATLNPGQTCEFPADFESIAGKCLIFDAYDEPAFDREERAEFGLLTLIEIHRTEMNFAMEFGGALLIEKLKDAGYYPYSDLDRSAVA